MKFYAYCRPDPYSQATTQWYLEEMIHADEETAAWWAETFPYDIVMMVEEER